MLQSIIIIDPKIELSARHGVNNFIIEPPVDTKGKVKDIGIAHIRQMVIWANQTAFIDQPRLVVISQASRLSLEAQQALLKTLEEPADDLTIIVCPQQITDLLPTIRSRCAVYQLSQLSPLQLDNWQLSLTTRPPSTSKLLNFEDWLSLDSWHRFTFLADYLKAKKDPQALIGDWLSQLSHHTKSTDQTIQAGHLDQALQSLQKYAPPRLVLTRLHALLDTQTS